MNTTEICRDLIMAQQRTNQRHPIIEDFRKKYESPEQENSTKSKSPIKMNKSTDKEIASMLNFKISQVIRRDINNGKYAELKNAYSTEQKTEFKVEQSNPASKNNAPVPKPRKKSQAHKQLNNNSLITDKDFGKMSVREKAQLYNQYFESMWKKANNEVDQEEHNAVEGEQKTENAIRHIIMHYDNTEVLTQTIIPPVAAPRKKLNITAKTTAPIPAPRTKRSSTTKTGSKIFSAKQFKIEKSELALSLSNTHSEEPQAPLPNKDYPTSVSEPPAPIPAPRFKRKTFSKSPSKTSAAKQSETEESDSGLSSQHKTSNDELQTATPQKINDNLENNGEFSKPLKPLRKKKLRRNAIWKKDLSLKETYTLTTTDSETDCQLLEFKTKNQQPDETPSNELQHATSFEELLQIPNRLMITPSKIKSHYMLYSDDLDISQCEMDDLNCTQLSEEIDKIYKTLENYESDAKLAKDENIPEVKSLTDSFTDQGFETEANELDSADDKARAESPQIVKDTKQQKPQNTFGFSTPIKNQSQQSFSGSHSAKQQLFSPISKPIKKRLQKSVYDSEARRSSVIMPAIKEDHPLEHHDNKSSSHLFTTEQRFFNNASTLPMVSNVFTSPAKKYSKFWIKCSEFSLTMDINYTESERLGLLYEIFSQTSCDTKDLHFGIDDQKFSVHNTNDRENNTTHISAEKGLSHYWFSTGDLVVPFSGKLLSAHKIQRLFQFIKSSVEESGILKFGVDDVEFSNVPEFWIQPAKFSIESNYSMLVGLQSGNSNGLEGRSKYAWPHSKPSKVTDLDESSYKAEEHESDFETIESGRLSFSPFGSNHNDLSNLDNDNLSMPRNSDAMLSLETYCYGYENEPLDQLFENNFNENHQPEVLPVPEMLTTVQYQQQNLSLVQNRLSCYAKPSYLPQDLLDDIKGTPEYLIQLKAIVADINNIISSERLKECSPKQLESYMFFMGQYADICLNNCQNHMDNVAAALSDYKGVVV